MPAVPPIDEKQLDDEHPYHAKQIGIRLAQARIVYGLKQRRWAKEVMGVAPNQVSQWESGYTVPTRFRLAIYKATVGVTADWMLFGDRSGVAPALLRQLDEARLIVGNEVRTRSDSSLSGDGND